MHEHHEAIHILEHAMAEAEQRGHTKVTKIVLVIGDNSGYSSEAVKMNFEMASIGTMCEGAEIEVKPVHVMLRCPKCNEIFARRPFHFECPHCGTEGEPTEIGKEMAIESVESI